MFGMGVREIDKNCHSVIILLHFILLIYFLELCGLLVYSLPPSVNLNSGIVNLQMFNFIKEENPDHRERKSRLGRHRYLGR